MSKKKKKARVLITLECIECRKQQCNKRSIGISRYLSSKNRQNTPKKLEIKKYCKFCNNHFIHKEVK